MNDVFAKYDGKNTESQAVDLLQQNVSIPLYKYTHMFLVLLSDHQHPMLCLCSFPTVAFPPLVLSGSSSFR